MVISLMYRIFLHSSNSMLHESAWEPGDETIHLADTYKLLIFILTVFQHFGCSDTTETWFNAHVVLNVVRNGYNNIMMMISYKLIVRCFWLNIDMVNCSRLSRPLKCDCDTVIPQQLIHHDNIEHTTCTSQTIRLYVIINYNIIP